MPEMQAQQSAGEAPAADTAEMFEIVAKAKNVLEDFRFDGRQSDGATESLG